MANPKRRTLSVINGPLPLSELHYMREMTVLAYIPVSRPQLRIMVQRGDFPKPRRLGPKTVVWRSTDLLDYMNKIEEKHAEGVA